MEKGSKMDHGKEFVNRKEAGALLGALLKNTYKGKNALVLGVPRGGVEVACYVAGILEGELSTIVTKKLPHPLQNELAIGAASEDGSCYLTWRGQKMEAGEINEILSEQRKEIKERIEKFRKGKPLPEMKGRTVIIVDDGIATGSTLIPALRLCRSRGAKEIVVASPVAGRNDLSEIDLLADDVKIVVRPEPFYAVGQVYEDFSAVDDEEVIRLLDEFSTGERKTPRIPKPANIRL